MTTVPTTPHHSNLSISPESLLEAILTEPSIFCVNVKIFDKCTTTFCLLTSLEYLFIKEVISSLINESIINTLEEERRIKRELRFILALKRIVKEDKVLYDKPSTLPRNIFETRSIIVNVLKSEFLYRKVFAIWKKFDSECSRIIKTMTQPSFFFETKI
ncbi:MAG: hypothetical protein QW303_01645 [Nitrososphaerota archaeon]